MSKLNMRKEKISGLDGRTYVRFTEDPSTEPRAFTIEASPSGVRLKGTMSGEMEDQGELYAFAKILSEAQKEHDQLRQAVIGNISRPS